MGYPQFVFTPRGGTSITVSFAGIARQVSKWAGGPSGNRKLSFTQGGKSAAVIHDVFEEYDVEIPGIRPSASTAYRTFYAGLMSWWEHALAGGVFAFTLDSAQSSATTLSGALAYTDTSCSVASTAGMAANDWLYFEDADDPTRWTRRKINAVASGITLLDSIGRPFVSGSVVRHAWYLPQAVCLDDGMPLIEREGGKGADMWDFKAKFRTVR
jgi:hypothetical protein